MFCFADEVIFKEAVEYQRRFWFFFLFPSIVLFRNFQQCTDNCSKTFLISNQSSQIQQIIRHLQSARVPFLVRLAAILDDFESRWVVGRAMISTWMGNCNCSKAWYTQKEREREGIAPKYNYLSSAGQRIFPYLLASLYENQARGRNDEAAR